MTALEQTLGELGEHLHRARRVLGRMDDGEGGTLTDLFAVMQTAIAWFTDLLDGRDPHPVRTTNIALLRTPAGIVVLVDDALDTATRQREAERCITLLRRADERDQQLAALLGLLAGLAARWTAVGFAPPLVLASLRRRAPRIRELGRSLAAA